LVASTQGAEAISPAQALGLLEEVPRHLGVDISTGAAIHGADPAVALPLPEHSVNDEDRDHQHQQQSRDRGQGVIIEPAPQPGVGQVKDHQGASGHRIDTGREPALPASARHRSAVGGVAGSMFSSPRTLSTITSRCVSSGGLAVWQPRCRLAD
jgi:hypothetical protein